ncbi:lipoyl synthase [Methylophilaceae bacterium]|jgi:lipoic acid synthetase|nr:lipoyl synthase [Methylophilaceae bacterium]|tara:strand:+ start:879 stop:1817 length:939 start_codon:yes stop_codon:yes gene_type:complete
MNRIINIKEVGKAKTARLPIKFIEKDKLVKPSWIKMKLPNSDKFYEINRLLKDNQLNTVCEEASCPNIGECYSKGTATFMILGEICTRRCPFCDVASGIPLKPDQNEPINLGLTIAQLKLNYVVITSVDRDDLEDGGASHFSECIDEIRKHNKKIKIEILVPDFRGNGKIEKALKILLKQPPNVFNHNLETIPRLYKRARPGARYEHSLSLLKEFKNHMPFIPTKSGLMLGLGETNHEILEVMKDLRLHNVDMLTLGQYLQPTPYHLPVERYVSPSDFDNLKKEAEKLGFTSVASGPMVRSSYHADQQAQGL